MNKSTLFDTDIHYFLSHWKYTFDIFISKHIAYFTDFKYSIYRINMELLLKS